MGLEHYTVRGWRVALMTGPNAPSKVMVRVDNVLRHVGDVLPPLQHDTCAALSEDWSQGWTCLDADGVPGPDYPTLTEALQHVVLRGYVRGLLD
jgi:hypothetical protein